MCPVEGTNVQHIENLCNTIFIMLTGDVELVLTLDTWYNDYNCHRYGLILTKQKFLIVPYSQQINFTLEITEVDNFLLDFSLMILV